MQPGDPHIVLLGDSIFDNGVYVPGEPDVVQQLRHLLPFRWRASLCAVDGAVTGDVPRQLARLPGDATRLVLSVGGNDALGAAHILGERAGIVADAVERLVAARDRFAAGYLPMLDAVLRCRLPTAVCTIYDANYPPPQGRTVAAALSLFNDVITRAAFARGLALIDLRLICSDPADYANPIEPSARGGEKIARAISDWAQGELEGCSSVIA